MFREIETLIKYAKELREERAEEILQQDGSNRPSCPFATLHCVHGACGS